MRLLPQLEGLHSAESFAPEFLQAFFARVREVEDTPGLFADALRGRVVAMVFLEPSTRTRLSFEAAVLRLGGSVITVADPRTASAAKGEALADTARVVAAYGDAMVLRHTGEGASRLAAAVTGMPVVNAGDGRLGHPTQTLTDLYTLYRAWGSFQGRTVGLFGDLAHGRTARSLLWGLVALGARVVFLPAPGLDWEPDFEDRVLARAGYRPARACHPLLAAWTGREVARVAEPPGAVQGRLFAGEAPPLLEHLDALYLTRLQQERGAAPPSAYPRLEPGRLEDPLLRDCLLLHPLPRRGELPRELDEDPRARYFEQVRHGPAVRAALFLALLRSDRWSLPPLQPLPAGHPDPSLGLCPNPRCITREEGLPVPWRLAGAGRREFLCALCDSRLEVDYAGCRSTRRLHPLHGPAVARIQPENLRPFRDRQTALREGYLWSPG